VYRVLVGNPEGKRLLDATPRSGWEDNIEMEFHETKCQSVECFGLDHDRFHKNR